MPMSKKDYQAFARMFYENQPDGSSQMEVGMWRELRDRVADLFEENNRFDRARFLEACETGTTKGMPKR